MGGGATFIRGEVPMDAMMDEARRGKEEGRKREKRKDLQRMELD